MGKNPAFLFYPSDWQRDLEEHPLEIEGAWIRICCKLWWSETRGSATKSLKQWARILRETPRKTEKIFDYFLQHSIADLVKQNSTITITSRRMVKDEKIREIRVKAGKMGGNPGLKKIKENKVLLNQNSNQSSNQKDRSSVSVSVNKEAKASMSPEESGNWNCPHSDIIRIYHEKLPMLRGVKVWNDKRKSYLKARWKEDEEQGTLEFWEDYFTYVRSCPFLLGENEKGWQADLEWLVTSSNFVKVIEGNYEPRKQRMQKR